MSRQRAFTRNETRRNRRWVVASGFHVLGWHGLLKALCRILAILSRTILPTIQKHSSIAAAICAISQRSMRLGVRALQGNPFEQDRMETAHGMLQLTARGQASGSRAA